ncbi:hypothetical protein Afil01_57510 [Actinorhabdospora filicis]|uniref:Uncharacterized protein n=1 Tax=Actinorhabdospora filicis TaxID=1785913 RepID=A0A9W6WBT1_9ACTN|nr:hypothetical protein [Actinorhabdospora filicis]GLZ80944.1 hypothetical protein Afil01_57510 [Actinorhabdospora filicis]
MSRLSRLHGQLAAGVPRWAVRTALVISLLALPSGIWRILLALNVPILEHSDAPPDEGPLSGLWYVIALSVVSEALAFLAFGLVARWGERVFGWRIPVLAATIPAALGSVALLIFPWAMATSALGMKLNGEPDGLILHGWQVAVFWVCYAPLALWPPLLAILTVHYYRRRTRAVAA